MSQASGGQNPPERHSADSQRPADSRTAGQPAEISLSPAEGWHCSHLYYRFNRAKLGRLTAAELETGRAAFNAALDPHSPAAPARLQVSAVSGHKADFGLMLLDADPLKIDSVHQRLMSGGLGAGA